MWGGGQGRGRFMGLLWMFSSTGPVVKAVIFRIFQMCCPGSLYKEIIDILYTCTYLKIQSLFTFCC